VPGEAVTTAVRAGSGQKNLELHLLPGLRSCRVILVAAIGWCWLAAEQGERFGDVAGSCPVDRYCAVSGM
jgi:hypothetical protein